MLKTCACFSEVSNFAYTAFPLQATPWKGKFSGSSVLDVCLQRTNPSPPHTTGNKKIPTACSSLVREKFPSCLGNHLKEHCYGSATGVSNPCLAFTSQRAAESLPGQLQRLYLSMHEGKAAACERRNQPRIWACTPSLSQRQVSL